MDMNIYKRDPGQEDNAHKHSHQQQQEPRVKSNSCHVEQSLHRANDGHGQEKVPVLCLVGFINIQVSGCCELNYRTKELVYEGSVRGKIYLLLRCFLFD